MKSADHSTLVAAVKAGGLVETLQGKGPFTVFAPVNAAFKALPEGTVETLLKPENKDMLVTVLTYHVVPGNLDNKKTAFGRRQQRQRHGQVQDREGGSITIKKNGDNLMIVDAKGGANIGIVNVRQSNGVIHVIDRVLMP